MMSRTNRELVEFFICYKLSQKNYPPSLLWPDDARTEGRANAAATAFNCSLADRRPGGGDLGAVKAALQDSADEFELLYTQAFSSLFSQLDVTPDTAYQSFKRVMDEVFKDGVNWGRVVGLFTFGGVLCVECAQKDMSHLVPRVADWMTTYLDENIEPWIASAGGWEAFGEIFGQGAIATRAGHSRQTLRRWLLVGVVLLTGVLIGVVVAKKQ